MQPRQSEFSASASSANFWNMDVGQTREIANLRVAKQRHEAVLHMLLHVAVEER